MAEAALKCVDLMRADGAPLPSLVPVRRRGARAPALTIDEQAAVLDAESFDTESLDTESLEHVDFVFFRRFSDGRSSQVAAYVVDNSDERLDEQALAELHLQVWLHGVAPLLYVAWPTRVDVLACARGPDFWEDEDLGGDESPVLRRLLLLTVLIKYREDRRVFPDGWFGRFHKGARKFFDVLRAEDPAKVERLLAFLERKFNGDVFRLPVNGRHKLTKTALRRFARLVEARTLKRQRCLWQQFSFEHLPVEIVSHLYQRFVHGGHGTVYTPSI